MASSPPKPLTTGFLRAKVTGAGRVVIPVELRRELAIEEGHVVLFSLEDGCIRVTPLREALRRAQEFCASLAPAEVVLSEELIDDRREEAARE